MEKERKQVLQIAATYIGTVVGAGFATGKEVMEFFTKFQWNGTVGILIASFLFIWLGTKMMCLSAKIGAYSFQDMVVYLAGRKMGLIFNWFMLIILLGVTSVILSGTGAVFDEQLGLSFRLGVLTSIFLCYVVMLKGIRGVLLVNSFVVPLMIFFSLLICGKTINGWITGTITMPAYQFLVNSHWEWIVRAFTYASLNLCLAQAVLVPLGREIKDEKVLKWGGILGGFGLCILLISSHLALMALDGAVNFDIPMAEVIRDFGVFIHFFYLIVIYGEIFTTLLGNVFGITRQLHSLSNISEKWIGAVVLFICLLISQIGFGRLLSALYPLFGYAGSFFLLLLIIKGNQIIRLKK